ncbi:Periplasmic binding protein [Thermotoga sp. 2812B]|nr:Periplasmic binding protein [Thermotoga sp. 2812B]EJX25338.1 Periplasmic binding protein [Thermotoga sp. EMP]
MAQHQLDIAWVPFDSVKAILQRVKTARSFFRHFPWIPTNVDLGVFGLTFNTARKPFDNPDVRWALILAIDIVDGVNVVLDGAATIDPIHIALTAPLYEGYFTKLEDWLKNFELDLGNGEKFKPYDPTVGFRLAELAKKKGYEISNNPEEIRRTFGPGWWKYAPDIAEKLLKKHGFYRDKDGKWHLPSGELWKITILATSPSSVNYESALIAAQSWRNFGIEVNIDSTDMMWVISPTGDFDVSTAWPNGWSGLGLDLLNVFKPFHSKYVVPVGENAPWGNHGRWSSPKMDEIIEALENTPLDDTEKLIELGLEGLKLLVREMPIVPTFNTFVGIVWDEYYWTNYPSAENYYWFPFHNYGCFKYVLPFLKSTQK